MHCPSHTLADGMLRGLLVTAGETLYSSVVIGGSPAHNEPGKCGSATLFDPGAKYFRFALLVNFNDNPDMSSGEVRADSFVRVPVQSGFYQWNI